MDGIYRTIIRGAAALSLTIVLASATGCGGQEKLTISGKVLKNGQPFTPAPGSSVAIIFLPETESEGSTFNASFKRATGTYQIELAPGKYRVNYVYAQKDHPAVEAPPEVKEQLHDLVKSQELDIEMK